MTLYGCLCQAPKSRLSNPTAMLEHTVHAGVSYVSEDSSIICNRTSSLCIDDYIPYMHHHGYKVIRCNEHMGLQHLGTVVLDTAVGTCDRGQPSLWCHVTCVTVHRLCRDVHWRTFWVCTS